MKLPDLTMHFPFFVSQIMVIFKAKVNFFLEIGSIGVNLYQEMTLCLLLMYLF